MAIWNGVKVVHKPAILKDELVLPLFLVLKRIHCVHAKVCHLLESQS